MTAPINNSFRDSSFQQFVDQIRKENSLVQEKTQKTLEMQREELGDSIKASTNNATRRVVGSINELKSITNTKANIVSTNIQNSVNINKDILANATRSYKLLQLQTERLTNVRKWGFLFTDAIKRAIYVRSPFLKYFNFAARIEVNRKKRENKEDALNRIRYLGVKIQQMSLEKLTRIEQLLSPNVENAREEEGKNNRFKTFLNKFFSRKDKSAFRGEKDLASIFGRGLSPILKTALTLGAILFLGKGAKIFGGGLGGVGKFIKTIGKKLGSETLTSLGGGIEYIGDKIHAFGVAYDNFMKKFKPIAKKIYYASRFFSSKAFSALKFIGNIKIGGIAKIFSIFKNTRFNLIYKMLNKNSKMFAFFFKFLGKIFKSFGFVFKIVSRGGKIIGKIGKLVPGLNFIIGLISTIAGAFKGFNMAGKGNLKDVGKLAGTFTGALGGLLDFLTFGVLDVDSFIENVAPGIQEVIDGILLGDTDMVFEGIVDSAKGIWDAILQSVITLWENVSNWIYENTKLGRWADSLVQGISDVYNGIIQGFNNIIKSAIDLLPAPLAREVKSLLGYDKVDFTDTRAGSYDLTTKKGRYQYLNALGSNKKISFLGDQGDVAEAQAALTRLEKAEFLKEVEKLKMQQQGLQAAVEKERYSPPVGSNPNSAGLIVAPSSWGSDDPYLKTERQVTHMR